MDSGKRMYKIPDGFLISYLLNKRIGEDKENIFRERNNISLRRIMDYCYANTAYTCAGIDECYYCTINYYVNEEMRSRRIYNPHCSILQEGERACSANDFLCMKDYPLHYALL